MNIPRQTDGLSTDQIEFLKSFSFSCRRTIIEMLKNSQSGHPGGSLSVIDFLSLLYTFVISQTGEKVVVSNGHVSPAVYSVLAELLYIPKNDVIDGFRKVGSVYEGHVTRHVPGIWYGTGPLGIGVSAASGFALSEKMNGGNKKVFALMGDGEAQEGQVHEMANFAVKHSLDNLIVFVDYNRVQLSGALSDIMPINIIGLFEAAGWTVLTVNAHSFDEMWKILSKARNNDSGKPVLIIGESIMGKGVSFMESEGKALKSTWHGKAPKPDEADKALLELQVTDDDLFKINDFLPLIKWKPENNILTSFLTDRKINVGTPRLYEGPDIYDCRSGYGNALKDLALLNSDVIALSADLSESVKTSVMGEEFPERHIECGIAEQHMISTAGALSLCQKIPFASTFGAFISSRAKDQARVNDINMTNVKMVSTHCGLSVGEDGPTHQAIDDSGSFLGMFNTGVIEPADINHTDRIIRFITSYYGNFYVRMGRHKMPVILKEDGTPYYDSSYVYEYGKTDLIRKGAGLTLVVMGSLVAEAVKAYQTLEKDRPFDLVVVSSIKKFDECVFDSIKRTGKVLIVEDHNAKSGLFSQLAKEILQKGISIELYESMAVSEYQLSGTAEDLYAKAGLNFQAIINKINFLNK